MKVNQLLKHVDNENGRHLSSLKGREIEILVEQDLIGRSACYAPVKLSIAKLTGTLLRARVIDADARFAYAEAV